MSRVVRVSPANQIERLFRLLGSYVALESELRVDMHRSPTGTNFSSILLPANLTLSDIKILFYRFYIGNYNH